MDNELAPFKFGQLPDLFDFADRVEERSRLIRNFSNNINTMLISPRRWGKSSLVKRVAEEMTTQQPEIKICQIDMYQVRSELEFYELLGSAVLKAAAGKWEEMASSIRNFFVHLVPKITLSADPVQDYSIGFDLEEVKKKPSEILDLAEQVCESKNIRMVICVDEFQNISLFENQLAFQKMLRAHWQRHKRVCYCLYGSKRQMLTDFFTKSNWPFYRFGEIMFLGKIKTEDWVEFICRRFEQTGKHITEGQAERIAQIMENHPYFVQELSQNVWFRTKETCQDNTIDLALETILAQYNILYQPMVERLSNPQLYFLKAMCDKVQKLSSKETIQAYRLGTSANVLKIKKALESQEIIDTMEGYPQFVDPTFRMWLQKRYFVRR